VLILAVLLAGPIGLLIEKLLLRKP